MSGRLPVRLLEYLPRSTERLTLRALQADDIDDVHGLLSDPVVMRFFPSPLSRAGAEAWLRRNAERYRQDGTGLFAVCVGATWIGDCGLVRRVIGGTPVLELGYHVRRAWWGQGYATEAATACVALAFEALDHDTLPSLTALIRPANRASRAVATRVGFRPAGATLHAGYPHERWELSRRETEGTPGRRAPA